MPKVSNRKYRIQTWNWDPIKELYTNSWGSELGVLTPLGHQCNKPRSPTLLGVAWFLNRQFLQQHLIIHTAFSGLGWSITPLSKGFFRQEYWSGLPCPSPGDLPDSGSNPGLLASYAESLPSEPPGKPPWLLYKTRKISVVNSQRDLHLSDLHVEGGLRSPSHSHLQT